MPRRIYPVLYTLDELPSTQVLPGFRARFVHSERMTFAYWEIEAGGELPEHAHEHEQVCHVLQGRFELKIAGETHVLAPGVVAVIPSRALHSGRALSACRVLDVFQPVRDDYQH